MGGGVSNAAQGMPMMQALNSYNAVLKDTPAPVSVVNQIAGMAGFIIMCMGLAGKIPSPTMGYLTVGLGVLSIGTVISQIMFSKSLNKPENKNIRNIALTSAAISILVLLILGSLNIAGKLPAKAVGLGMLATNLIMLAPILLPFAIVCLCLPCICCCAPAAMAQAAAARQAEAQAGNGL